MATCEKCGKKMYSSQKDGLCLDCKEDPQPEDSQKQDTSILVTTTFSIEGNTIEKYLGIVRGIIVRSPTIMQGITGGIKDMVGGEIGGYTKMCETARIQAYNRMLEEAKKLGANAVVGFKYESSDVIERSTEVLCYGTAVVLNSP